METPIALTHIFAFIWTENAGGETIKVARSNIPKIANLRDIFLNMANAREEINRIAMAEGIPEDRILIDPVISGYEELLALEAS